MIKRDINDLPFKERITFIDILFCSFGRLQPYILKMNIFFVAQILFLYLCVGTGTDAGSLWFDLPQ